MLMQGEARPSPENKHGHDLLYAGGEFRRLAKARRVPYHRVLHRLTAELSDLLGRLLAQVTCARRIDDCVLLLTGHVSLE
jgi:hypothetical protein